MTAVSLLDRPAEAVVRAVLNAGIGTRAGLLVVPQEGDFNAATGGTDASGAPLEYPVRAIPGESYASQVGLDAGTLVQNGEQAWLIPGTAIEPTTAMRFRISGSEWAIKGARAVSSGERNALWLLIVGGA
jgi:hypothetical protein